MIVSFPCWRKGEVKILGSVITEALSRGHDVRLVWKHDEKPGESVDVDALQRRWPAATIVEQFGPMWPAAQMGRDPLVALVPLAAVTGHSWTHLPSWVRVVSIDHCLNHLSAPLGARVDLLTLTSEWQREQWNPSVNHPMVCEGMAWIRRGTRAKVEVTGDPLLDGLRACDADATRERYGLNCYMPSRESSRAVPRPVVILFALKLKVGHAWRRWVYANLGYRQTVQAVRRLCDRTGALLVVKSREKNGDPAWLHRLADRVVYDDDLYPCTSHQLLSVASYAIHWQSGAVYECAAAGVPSLSIHVPQPHLASYPSTPLLFPAEVRAHANPQDWPGVVDFCHWREAAHTLNAQQALPVIDPESRRGYLQTICGFTDLRSAARVMDAVEGL